MRWWVLVVLLVFGPELYFRTLHRADWSEYRGEYAVVTGASYGLGYGFAIELASKGINVVVTGRSSGKLEALCRRAQDEFHVKCVVVVQDVQKKPDWDRVMEQLKGLDISVLVNNVGGGNVEGVVKPLHEYTLEEHDFIQQLNWGAAFGWTYRLLPIMHRRQKGRVLMISSLTCYACYSGIYSANKLALYGLTRTINNEYLPAIRAETIHVGLVSTPAVALTSTDQLGVVVSSEYCARQTLASFGFREEYVPTLMHALINWMGETVPMSIRQKLARGGTESLMKSLIAGNKMKKEL